MKTGIRVLTLVLLLALCVASGYGWGNLTHVYIAKHLGVKFGPVNMNEMYGAVLPDMFNLAFTVPNADKLAESLHINQDLWAALFAAAPSLESRGAFWGVYTHNNLWGADRRGHGVYPADKKGWVIKQAMPLAPGIAQYLVSRNDQILGIGEENLAELALGLGHDIVETAVEVLLRRELDPLAGARLSCAARERSPRIPEVMAAVLGSTEEERMAIQAGEAEYQQGMIGYGQMFMLPEAQLIATIGEVSAGMATAYIKVNTGLDVSVESWKVKEYLRLAMTQVKPVYKLEIFATMAYVQNQLHKHGIEPVCPVLAFEGNGTREEEFGTESSSSVEALPTEYRLEQNYPNPFNPSTAIRFALPADGNVTLKVYNAIGQEVATLLDAYTAAGRHEIRWDAKSLPSGVYLYRLAAGTVVETKKMTLMK